jgi:hypothetical protein
MILAQAELEDAKRTKAMGYMAVQGFTKQRDELYAKVMGIPLPQPVDEQDAVTDIQPKRSRRKGKKGKKK